MLFMNRIKMNTDLCSSNQISPVEMLQCFYDLNTRISKNTFRKDVELAWLVYILCNTLFPIQFHTEL